MKLVQKRFLKGSREFEILEDSVQVRISSLRRVEKLTVSLAIINPVPVVNEQFLEFHSRVNADPLLELFMEVPNASTFNAFVDELKRRAQQEYNKFSGLRTGAAVEGLAANSYEEPPAFDEPGRHRPAQKKKPVRRDSIESSIRMLEQHLERDNIEELLAALQSLMADPDNEQHLLQLVNAFNDLGPQQGAVLTYAPYVGILLSDNPPEY